MNFNLKNRKDFILPAAVVLLVLLYAVSVSVQRHSSEPESFLTAFINPEKAGSLESISILASQSGENITFVNEDGLWKSKNILPDGSSYVFPIEQKQLVSFVDNLKNIRKMYKISYNYDAKSVTFNTEYTIFYRLSDGTETKFFLGSSDFSKTMRYVRLETGSGIFKTQDDFSRFLNASASFWYDPFIVPRNAGNCSSPDDVSLVSLTSEGKTSSFSDSKKISRLLDLRHGFLFPGKLPESPAEETLSVFLSDGSKITAGIYPDAGGGKIISYSFSGWFYAVRITDWTYRSIRELF